MLADVADASKQARVSMAGVGVCEMKMCTKCALALLLRRSRSYDLTRPTINAPTFPSNAINKKPHTHTESVSTHSATGYNAR